MKRSIQGPVILLAVCMVTLLMVAAFAKPKESDPQSHPEGKQWGFTRAAGENNLPRVLLIGDSIVRGYQSTVAAQLKGKAVVDVWRTGMAESSPDLHGMLRKALANGPYAVVHFNIGLHGFQKGRIPEGQYEPLMRKYVAIMKESAPKATLVWASSTPVMIKGKPAQLDPAINPIIVERNTMAAKIMEGNGILIDDLYGLMVDKLNLAHGDQFHWSAAGQALQGKTVAAIILKNLQAPARTVGPAPVVLKAGHRWPVDPALAHPSVTLAILDTSKPLIHEKTPGMEKVKYGNEGGEVVKDRKGVYHWFTSEQYGDPYWVANRITHWTSVNGTDWVKDTSWSKDSTVDITNTKERAGLFDPIPVYDEDTGYWYLFYMGYRYLPLEQYRELLKQLNSPCKKDNNGFNRGKIYRAKAMKPGLDGLGGPYHDRDADDVVILEPLANPPPYEATWVGNTEAGYGCVTVTPYKVGKEWYILFSENMLAKSDSLAGTFTRLPEGPDNPISYQRPLMGWKPFPFYLECPVIYKVPPGNTGAGTYVMLVGMHRDHLMNRRSFSYGYATSRDGIHWSAMEPLPRIAGGPLTACSFIPEGNDIYSLYVTDCDNKNKYERLHRYKVKLSLRKE